MIPCRLDSQAQTYHPLATPSLSNSDFSSKFNKNFWYTKEDLFLSKIIIERGARNWSSIAKEINFSIHNSKPLRQGKQCRERWFNHLNPELLKGQWTEEEDSFILRKQLEFGNKWSEIAKCLQGRNENQVKNRWKSLNKREENIRKNELRGNKKHEFRICHKSPESGFCVNVQGCIVEEAGNVQEGFQQLDEGENQTYEFGKDSFGVLNTGKQEEGCIALRISSLTSDPDLQSGKGFDLNDLYSWKGKIDIDYLYGTAKDQDKIDFDSCMANYLKTPEQQVWGSDTDEFNKYFVDGVRVEQGDNEEKTLFENNFMAGFGGINMFEGS